MSLLLCMTQKKLNSKMRLAGKHLDKPEMVKSDAKSDTLTLHPSLQACPDLLVLSFSCQWSMANGAAGSFDCILDLEPDPETSSPTSVWTLHYVSL